jgi:hypothetical protein
VRGYGKKEKRDEENGNRIAMVKKSTRLKRTGYKYSYGKYTVNPSKLKIIFFFVFVFFFVKEEEVTTDGTEERFLKK